MMRKIFLFIFIIVFFASPLLAEDKLKESISTTDSKVAEKILPSLESRVEKALEITPTRQTYFSGGWGGVYESGSGTNNFFGFNASASYGNIFKLINFSGNYEVTGKYAFNQINYLVPKNGGAVTGEIANESRYELEINTINPLVQFYGINGKLLLGLRYINLSNNAAPINFTCFNAGIVTSSKFMERNFLLQFFYSFPFFTATSPSVLGNPTQLLDFEASLDAEFFSTPLLFGLGGEAMLLSGGSRRIYYTAFTRYFIL